MEEGYEGVGGRESLDVLSDAEPNLRCVRKFECPGHSGEKVGKAGGFGSRG